MNENENTNLTPEGNEPNEEIIPAQEQGLPEDTAAESPIAESAEESQVPDASTSDKAPDSNVTPDNNSAEAFNWEWANSPYTEEYTAAESNGQTDEKLHAGIPQSDGKRTGHRCHRRHWSVPHGLFQGRGSDRCHDRPHHPYDGRRCSAG